MTNSNEIKCKQIIERNNKISSSGFLYSLCNRTAKYRVRLNNPINGNLIEINLCGIHFKAAQKNCTSINKKTGFNSNFEFEILQNH